MGRHAVRYRGYVNRLQLRLPLFSAKQNEILLMTEPDALRPAAIEEIVARSRTCFVVAAPYPSRGTVCQRRSTIDPIERRMTLGHAVCRPRTASKHVALRFLVKIYSHCKWREPIKPWSNFKRIVVMEATYDPLVICIGYGFCDPESKLIKNVRKFSTQ